jgi:energy-coupling factor transporter ATP-binding protein EcfA2
MMTDTPVSAARPAASEPAAAGGDPIYRAEGLRFAWPGKGGNRDAAPVLTIDFLDIFPGDCLALTGPNGSGKTTLLKLLDGLLQPTAGNLVRPPLPNSGGVPKASVYVHQHPWLLDASVRHNVALACAAAGLGAAETRNRVARSLERVGLGGWEERRARRLSGGEAQRVALARALAGEFPILLLDEPASAADSVSQELVARLLPELAAAGRTIVFASHDSDFVATVASRVVQLRSGRVVGHHQLPHPEAHP